jgi:hypothetical protein
MSEITQTQLDEIRRKNVLINKESVLEIVKKHFEDAHNSLSKRPNYDQIVLGAFITTLETELKKDLKQIKEG